MQAVLDKKKIYTTLFRVAVSAALLVWLFCKADMGVVWTSFTRLAPSVWVFAIGLFFVICIMAATRWFLLSMSLGLAGGWSSYVSFYYIGQFFNLFMPSTIGGDFFKVMFVSRGRRDIFAALLSVAGDRVIGLLTMLLTGTAALLLFPEKFCTGKESWLLCGSGIVVIGLLLLFLFRDRLLSVLPRVFAEKLMLLAGLYRHPATLIQIVLLSILLNSAFVAVSVVLARHIGINLHPSYYFVIFPLTAMITVLPVSFNGMGLREGSMVYLLALQNIPFEKALSLSLCIFAVQCSAGVAGGLLYALGLYRREECREQFL